MRKIYKVQINGQKADRNNIECLTCSIVARHLADYNAYVVSSSPESLRSSAHTGNMTSPHPNHFHSNSSCRYSNAVMSPSLEYYVHECLGPTIPYVEVRSLPNNKLVKLLLTNQQLRDRALEKAFPRMLQLRVPLLVDNTPFKRSKPDYVAVELYLPPGLREDESTLYPLLIWT